VRVKKKVAGAVAASKSASLEEVHAAAKVAAESVKTLGVAMTTCTVPGTASSDRLDKDTIEIGLGIHGNHTKKKKICIYIERGQERGWVVVCSWRGQVEVYHQEGN
jgi:dihydroxyacetone kinase